MKDSMREVRFTSAEGEGSIRSKLAKGGPIAVRLRIPPDSDVEGHSLGDSVVLAIAKFDDGDVEGHALNIHFPNAGQARRFRNEMIAAGALTATLALGVGLSQLAPSAQLGQSQVGSGAQSNTVWIGIPHQVGPIEGGAAAPAVQIPHQVAPIEGDAAAPAVPVPHQVPPDDL
ncbi:MAG: hypothetical protein M3P32_06935 [Chloroflexota bacterium]|nr:hypothetical protein [Chloroflexota bacterium]